VLEMAVWSNIYGETGVMYEDCVLDTYERNGYDDSDWYAVCWDAEKGRVVDVNYDTTRCGGSGWAEIDATEDTLRSVYRFYKAVARGQFDSRYNKEQAMAVRKGDTVKVIRGRKIPKGGIGRVFWVGTRFNPYSRLNEERVGIEIDGVRQFLPLEYVEVIGWEARLITGRRRKVQIRNAAIQLMPRLWWDVFINSTMRKAV